jgi:dTDP-3-amino-3,4,6-trideoxy-alpha-D-glucose transaminase
MTAERGGDTASPPPNIPLLDLAAANAAMQSEIDEALLRVARSGRYILGPEVEAFEAEWAAYCGAKYCVGTGNALDALRIVLMAWGVGPGDEVIVPANTYIATWMAVSLVGATPVPVDADLETMNLDVMQVSKAITQRTRVILPVHLYGSHVDVARLQVEAGASSNPYLKLLVDGAQAHGARSRQDYRSLVHAEAFSFYPSKNLGALGDGGAIVTDDYCLAEVCRRLRNYGGVGRLDHTVIGINSRLDEMQAAVLRAKLPYLDRMNEARRFRAGIYDQMLPAYLKRPPRQDGSVYHQYVVRTLNRDRLVKEAAARGLDLHVHYPVPPYREGAYFGFKGSFPVADRLAREVVSLPIGYDVAVEAVCHTLHELAVKTEALCPA